MIVPDNRPRLSRRALLRAGGGASVGALAAAFGAAPRPAAASGAEGIGAPTLLHDYAGWRTTWDLIVPLMTLETWPRTFLLYDRAAGYASVQSVARDGALTELRAYADWRRSWSVIAASSFVRTATSVGVVFYDRAAGHASLQSVDVAGVFKELRAHPNLRRSWDLVVPFSFNDVLFYDRAAGYAEFASADRTGGLRQTRADNDWRTTWDLIAPGFWNLGQSGREDLLLYDRNAGEGRFVTVDAAANLTAIRADTTWERVWDAMSGERMTFLRADGSAVASDLLLIDRNAGRLAFWSVGEDANPTLVFDGPAAPAGWSHVVPIGPSLLLCYDRAAGRARFLRTDAAPPPIPTPTPPPTATPRPTASPRPTRTPAPTPTEGRTRIVLEQDKGRRDWDTYTLRNAPDPITGGGGDRAIVTSVTNRADKRISLTHRDRADRRTGPVYLKSGETAHAFDGMGVGGEWVATVDASQSAAPNRITLEISYVPKP